MCKCIKNVYTTKLQLQKPSVFCSYSFSIPPSLSLRQMRPFNIFRIIFHITCFFLYSYSPAVSMSPSLFSLCLSLSLSVRPSVCLPLFSTSNVARRLAFPRRDLSRPRAGHRAIDEESERALGHPHSP